MSNNLLIQDSCPICLINYDQKNKIPMFVCPEQHLCCNQCLLGYEKASIQFQCPLCRNDDIPIKSIRKFKCYFPFRDRIMQIQKQCWFEKLEKEKYQKQLSLLKIKEMEQNINLLISGTKQIRKIVFQKLIQQAKSLLIINKIKGAACILQTILENNSLQDKGQFIGLGSYEESIGYYENNAYKWFERTYKNRRISINDLLALCYLSQPNFEHQKEWFEQMLEKEPNNMRLTYGLAITLHNASKLDQAFKLYKTITKASPSFARAWEMLGFIQMARGRKLLCLRYIQQCLSHDPSNIYAKFARCLYRNKKLSPQQMFKIHSEDINYVRPLYHIAQYYYNYQIQNALSNWELCIEINPFYLDPFISKARYLYKSRKLNSAIQILKNVYKKDLTNEQRQRCQKYLGNAYYQIKDYRKSIYYFQLYFSDQNYEKEIFALSELMNSCEEQ